MYAILDNNMELIKNLPNDIIYEIMSFSHPEISFRYSMVVRQFMYYTRDYNIKHNVSFVSYMLERCDKRPAS